MEIIEKVKILNSKEISSLIENYKLKSLQSKESISNYIIKHSEALINEYENYESLILTKYYNELKEYNYNYNLWKLKKCICGSPLKYINNFWGCPNYKDLSIVNKHTNFNDNQEFIFQYKFKHIKVRLINIHWCSTILSNLRLKDVIKAKELFLFYESVGLDDLREKYDDKSSHSNFNTYSKVNISSKIDEEKVKNHLSNYFDKLLYQPYIKYNYTNSKNKICRPDFILSNSNDVFIIEVKRTDFDIDIEQLELYYSLIKHKLDSCSDKRNLISVFIVNEKLTDLDFNYIIIQELIKNNSKEDIIKLLKKNQYYF